MKMITLFAATLALGASCKRNTEDKPSTPPTGSATGSATMGSGSAGAAVSHAPKPLTPDDLAKRVHECWGFWGAGKWDDLQSCYEKDASYDAPGSGLPPLAGSAAIVELMKGYRVAFPDQKGESQLLLINGKKAVTIALIAGKNTGAMKMPAGDLPATNNKMGIYLAQSLTFDDTGKVTHEDDFFDTATELGQLKPTKEQPVRPAVDKLPMVGTDVIATDDAKETSNLEAFKQLTDRFDKHDVKGFGDLLADDLVWSEQPQPKDVGKKELMAELPAMWKGFSDLKFTVTHSWAAGSYVVALETFDGTNDGDLPTMHVKKTGKRVSLPFFAVYKFDGGKMKAAWVFYQASGFASQLGSARAPTTIAQTAKEPPAPAAKAVENKK